MINGEDRPKQFCRFFGGKTLLAQTRSRIARAISPERTLFTGSGFDSDRRCVPHNENLDDLAEAFVS
jgi:mannose-1-phosphate guanylyltransferase